MAARHIQRRLLSAFCSTGPQSSPCNRRPWRFFPAANSVVSRHDLCKRRIQTMTEPSEQAVEEATSLRPDSDSAKLPANATSNENSAVKFKADPNLKISARHDLAMIFTCKVCETRSIKTMCRESYEKGVVVARCGGCNNLHLIADHLGWFGQPGSIEDFLAARGEEVKKGSVDTLNLTLEELAGKGFGK
ncbi:uncharacterized protein C24H6.02c [Diospyros lotus]|uniref:uncharacterized protein C24H6.02c n=1 Tax=Diospyros lotus TaxID=55363 RepID=UPI0022504497|nr:uncharacterized protein C24H6.02c [Diospyros lotus]